jgi:hypothetical protein
MKTILIIILAILILGGGITIYFVEKKPAPQPPPNTPPAKQPAAASAKSSAPSSLDDLIDQLSNDDNPVSPIDEMGNPDLDLQNTIATLNNDY